MKKKITWCLIAALPLLILPAIFVSTGELRAQEPRIVKKKIIVGQVRMIKKMEKMIIVATPRPGDLRSGQSLYLAAGGKEIALSVKMPASSSVLCSVSGGSSNLNMIEKDMWVYAYQSETVKTEKPAEQQTVQPATESAQTATADKSEEEQKKTVEKENAKNEEKIKEDISAMSFLRAGIVMNTNDFEQYSPIYSDRAGIMGAHISAGFFNYKLSTYLAYQRPIPGDKDEASPEIIARVSYPLFGTYRCSLSVKGEYHHLTDADEYLTSSYAKGTASATIYSIPGDPKLSYTHFYYTDDYDGDRQAAKDFEVNGSLTPYHDRIELIDDVNAILMFSGNYRSLQYQESKSAAVTTAAQKGISDISGSLKLSTYLAGLYAGAEYMYSYIPASDFNAVTGKSQHRFSVTGGYHIVSSISFLGGWDYIRLPDAKSVDSSAHVFKLSASASF
ncbi:MAG: hypothetical protein ACRCUT_00860 [Spirochaetota bacterium]